MLTKAQHLRISRNASFYTNLFEGVRMGTIENMLAVMSQQGRDFRAMEFIAFMIETIPAFNIDWLSVTADKQCALALQSIRFTSLDCLVGMDTKLYNARRSLQVELFQGVLNVGYRKIRPGSTVASFIENYSKQTHLYIAAIQRKFDDPLECIRVVSEVMIHE